MKALTLTCPWAFAIRDLGKDVENRGWRPPDALIGQRFAIHAGKAPAQTKRGLGAGWNEVASALDGIEAAGLLTKPVDLDNLVAQSSAVVAVATLAGWRDSRIGEWRTADRLPPRVRHLASPWGVAGQVHWFLEQVTQLAPVPCRGAQGLWSLPQDVEAAVLAQLRERGAA